MAPPARPSAAEGAACCSLLLAADALPLHCCYRSYERVGPRHSWNASHIYTNSAAFKLQRHSDHHAAASTPYHRLRDLPEAPQLPTSYPGMMLLATWPPLFRRVMDPRVRREAAKGMPATAAAAAGGARQ
jgi:hypothetical protein